MFIGIRGVVPIGWNPRLSPFRAPILLYYLITAGLLPGVLLQASSLEISTCMILLPCPGRICPFPLMGILLGPVQVMGLRRLEAGSMYMAGFRMVLNPLPQFRNGVSEILLLAASEQDVPCVCYAAILNQTFLIICLVYSWHDISKLGTFNLLNQQLY